MKKVSSQIRKALVNKYIADFDAEVVNLANLVHNSVGIGDHTDIVGEADKIVEKLAHIADKVSMVDVNIGSSAKSKIESSINCLWEDSSD